MNESVRIFLEAAKGISELSPDPSKKIGAIFSESLSDDSFLAAGFNTFPQGIKVTEERINTNEEKDKYIIHAERSAVSLASRAGVSLDGSILFVYGLPICNDCALESIQAGVKEVYIQQPRVYEGRWKSSCEQALINLAEASVKVTRYDMDGELIN